MFSTLRKIRKQVVDSGRFKSYLLYALGEIVLIMLGVLGAIQVDNWNERRKNKVEEKTILINLLDDLQNAKKQSTDYIIADGNQLNLLEGLLTITKNDSLIHHPKVDSLFYKAIWSVENNVPLVQSYTDLKGSGKDLLISNTEIRDKLTFLENAIKNLSTLQLDRFTVQQIRIDQIAENDVNFVSLVRSQKIFNINSDGIPNDYNKLLSNPTIRNLFGIKLVLTNDIFNARKDVDKLIDELIKIIKADISNI